MGACGTQFLVIGKRIQVWKVWRGSEQNTMCSERALLYGVRADSVGAYRLDSGAGVLGAQDRCELLRLGTDPAHDYRDKRRAE